MLVRFLETQFFSDLVKVEIDFAFLLSDAVETRAEVQAIALANLEQKRDNSSRLHRRLLFEPAPELKQLAVSDEHVDAKVQLCEFIHRVRISGGPHRGEELVHHLFCQETSELLILELTIVHESPRNRRDHFQLPLTLQQAVEYLPAPVRRIAFRVKAEPEQHREVLCLAWVFEMLEHLQERLRCAQLEGQALA